MSEARRIDIGAFARVLVGPHREKGIGKVVRIDGPLVVMRYFDTPDDPEPPEVTVPATALKVMELPAQTRVFLFDRHVHRWRVGRVLEGGGVDVLVQFPNREVKTIAREELETRWRQPILDSTLFLARGVTETPRFAYARSDFIRAITAQRAACLGMSAVLSSRIQLADYQFKVVRRVLQDPVQRYLLADEVGLGKTIEAGVLIRQYLLDSPPTAHVLVIAPTPLVAQWRQELRERFMLADWLDDFLFVVPSSDLNAIDAHLRTAGMLVVDEAHHLSRQGTEGGNALYERLRVLARGIQHLLLLSATPVLADTEGFLRMLHLLDPGVFPLDDLAGFERRLASRQLVAETIAGLAPEHVLSMEDELDRLESAFGDDPTLRALIDNLRPVVQRLPEEDDPEFTQALTALRSHLTETYRLHRRILRNRRRSVPWATPRRAGMETLSYRCNVAGERAKVLDELRVHLFNLEASDALMQSLFSLALHPTGASSLRLQLDSQAIDDPHVRRLAAQMDQFMDDRDAIGARVSATVDAVHRLLTVNAQQVVVFCDRSEHADRVTAMLREAFPGETIQRHTCVELSHGLVDEEEESETADTVQAWQAFLRDPERCRVLVCDARSEEGLNLHGGRKVALHYDLPANPNRLEQRLGRLDRFGAGEPIRSMAVICADDPTESAWLTCLDQGFDVFRHSIASLQYLIESSLRQATIDWIGTGVAALIDWNAQLAGPKGWVARELRRIDQQDALDSLDEGEDEAFERLEVEDAEWDQWRNAFSAFTVDNLLFRAQVEPWDGSLPKGEQVLRFAYDREGPRSTLLSLPAFTDSFLGTIDTEHRNSRARHPLTFPYAFRRGTALSRQGMARGVRPLRCGDPLVESLSTFCDTDDRGRSFAMWRHLPGHNARDASGIDLYFRFDVHVEVDPSSLSASDPLDTRALRRHASGIFPPQAHTVWVSIDGTITNAPPPELRTPYTLEPQLPGGGRDYNLNPERWYALERVEILPWLSEWKRHCLQARDASMDHLRSSPAMLRDIQTALTALARQREERLAQLRARTLRLDGAARTAELGQLTTETLRFDLLAKAIASPNLHVDVAGAVFLSPLQPFPK
ncbi:protein DpdE [Dyella japonica]|uniref:ATP-dependent helicase HepA n=1 Tax=Dyella japonica TaxID=231455 RepID=A0ABV2JXM0_9GAMM